MESHEKFKYKSFNLEDGLLKNNEIPIVKAIRESVRIDGIYDQPPEPGSCFITKFTILFRNEEETDAAFEIAINFKDKYNISKNTIRSIVVSDKE